MNALGDPALRAYFRSAKSWADDRARSDRQSYRLLGITAAFIAVIALLEAVALMLLIPLKTVEPHMLLVDRHTGFVQALNPREHQEIAFDTALTRSFLTQYVVAREGFNIDAVKAEYRKVALWSANDARKAYLATMQVSHPESPFQKLPREAVIAVDVRSVSALGSDTALVRFSTTRTDPGGRQYPSESWVSVIRYRFSNVAMTSADRFINPLGFQVVRYQRDAETLRSTGSDAETGTRAPRSATNPPADAATQPLRATGADAEKEGTMP